MNYRKEDTWRFNTRRFQKTLEKIVEKYSLIQHEQDAVDVDLNNTQFRVLGRYMKLSKMNLDKLESTSFMDLTVEPSAQDLPSNTVLDSTCNDKSKDFEITSISDSDGNNVTQCSDARLTNILDERLQNSTLFSDQPEDHDDVLEMSLQSRGSSLGDSYPDMVNQIGMAWRRQQVSEAAESVRRRYQRWRKSAQSRSTNSSLIQRKPLETSKGKMFSKLHKSPVKIVTSTVSKAGFPSPLKTGTISGQKLQYYHSPVRKNEAPVVVLDMPAIFEESERLLNKTFTFSEPSLVYSASKSSPPIPCHSPQRPFKDLSFRMKEPDVSLHRLQTEQPIVHGRNLLKERNSSPVRTSPFKSMLTSRDNFNKQTDFYGSPTRLGSVRRCPSKELPQQFPIRQVASPKSPFMKQSLYKELNRSNSACNFVPSPSKPTLSTLSIPRKNLSYPDQRLSPQEWSPKLTKQRSQNHGFRRHLSFDSSTQPWSRPSYSCKDFDDEFTKLYHKLVCLNKSSLVKGQPCRFCAKNALSSRGHSSSSLEALALSPHRPLLRKRQLDLQSYPFSKRYRDEYKY